MRRLFLLLFIVLVVQTNALLELLNPTAVLMGLRGAVTDGARGLDRIGARFQNLARAPAKLSSRNPFRRRSGVTERQTGGGISTSGTKTTVTNQADPRQSARTIRSSTRTLDDRTEAFQTVTEQFWSIITSIVTYSYYLVFFLILYPLYVIISFLVKGLSDTAETKAFIARERAELEEFKRSRCACDPLLIPIYLCGLILMLLKGFIRLCEKLVNWLPFLLVFFLLLCLFVTIQVYNTSILNGMNSGTMLVQKGVNTFTGTINTGKKAMNIMIPIMNVNTYTSINSVRILFKHFLPEDAVLEFTTPTTGRRLANVGPDGSTQLLDISRFASASQEVVIPTTQVLELMGQFNNMILDFWALLVAEYFEPILFVLSRVTPKLMCFMNGGIVCGIREIFDFYITIFVERAFMILRSVTFGLFKDDPPTISIGCTAEELGPQVSPLLCAGMLWDLEPPGAVFSDLKRTVIPPVGKTDQADQARNIQRNFEGRRLSGGGEWIWCSRSPHDGSYSETMGDRVLHRAHRNGCPHSRDLVVNPLYAKALQFHRLDILDNCVNVCLDGLHILSCHGSELVQAVGPCDGIPPPAELNHTVVQSKIRDLFGKDAELGEYTEQQQQQDEEDEEGPPSVRRDLRAMVITKEELIQKMRQNQPKSKFQVGNFECKLGSNNNTSAEGTLIDAGCILSQHAIWNRLGPDQATIHNFFTPGPVSTLRRRSLQEQQRSESEVKTAEKLHALGDKFVQSLNRMTKNARLLRTARDAKDKEFRRKAHALVAEDGGHYYSAYQASLNALHELAGPPPKPKRGRRLEDISTPTSIQVVGDCPGDMYLCPNMYQCVLNENMNDCIPVDDADDPSIFQRGLQYIHDAATLEPDIKGFITENVVQCWSDYDTKPETKPFLISNMRGDTQTGKHCFPLIAPYTYFFPPIEENGIRNYVTAALCNGTTEIESTDCFCQWYHPVKLYADIQMDGFIDLWAINHYLNTLLVLQSMIYLFFTGPGRLLYPVHLFWQWFAGFLCGNMCEPWVPDLFGNLGYEKPIGDTQRMLCAFLNAGSVMFTAFTIMIVYLLIVFLWPAMEFTAKFIAPSLNRYSFRAKKYRR